MRTRQTTGRGDRARRRRRGATRGLLSAVALGAVGSAAVFTTQATFTDSVSMAQVSVTGGTLDVTANSGNGPNQAWNVSMVTTGMAPGQENTGTVAIRNNGDLPFTITVSKTGADASNCFSYYFRETSPLAVNFTGMGTAVGSDVTTAPMATTITNFALPDSGADVIWEAGDVKTYSLTTRMNAACTTNAANATMNYTFNATQ